MVKKRKRLMAILHTTNIILIMTTLTSKLEQKITHYLKEIIRLNSQVADLKVENDTLEHECSDIKEDLSICETEKKQLRVDLHLLTEEYNRVTEESKE